MNTAKLVNVCVFIVKIVKKYSRISQQF